MTDTKTTKRQAILLLFSGVISKMAHADEKGTMPSLGYISFAAGLQQVPMGITLNLDSFTGVTVTMGGKEITITSADLFKALANG